MENTSRLYDTLVETFGQLPMWRDRRHLYTLAWMLVGWLSAAEAGLCAWIPYVKSRAQMAQSVQRRFRRWLANARIDVDALYAPLIQAALAEWGEAKLYLALDTTLLWDQVCLVRVSVIYRGRAVPVVWKTLGYSSNAVAFEEYAPLLRQTARLLPVHCPVTLLADRAFADVRLLTLLDTELHWHWRLRLKHHITVRRKGFYRRRLSSVLPPPGHACSVPMENCRSRAIQAQPSSESFGAFFISIIYVLTAATPCMPGIWRTLGKSRSCKAPA